MTKAKEKTVPVGTDLSMLVKASGTQKLGFEFKGHRWSLEYVPISWEQQWDAVQAAWTIEDEESRDFNVKDYYVILLLDSKVRLVDSEEPFSEEFLRELEPEVFARITNAVPSPVLNLEIDRAKKD